MAAPYLDLIIAAVVGLILAPLLLQRETDAYPEACAKDIKFVVNSNVIASIGAVVSIAIWVMGGEQNGNVLAVFPMAALGGGLFATSFGLLGVWRYRRPLMMGLTVWGCAPLVWVVLYQLVLRWTSIDFPA